MHLILAISRESQNYIVNRTLTKPEKSQSAAYFNSIKGLPSTLIRHENREFRKRCSSTEPEKFEKRQIGVLVRTENILKTEHFNITMTLR